MDHTAMLFNATHVVRVKITAHRSFSTVSTYLAHLSASNVMYVKTINTTRTWLMQFISPRYLYACDVLRTGSYTFPTRLFYDAYEEQH